jgi:hypothetical protein
VIRSLLADVAEARRVTRSLLADVAEALRVTQSDVFPSAESLRVRQSDAFPSAEALRVTQSDVFRPGSRDVDSRAAHRLSGLPGEGGKGRHLQRQRSTLEKLQGQAPGGKEPPV